MNAINVLEASNRFRLLGPHDRGNIRYPDVEMGKREVLHRSHLSLSLPERFLN